MSRKTVFRISISVAVGVAVFLLLLVLQRFHLLDTWELKTLDYRFTMRGPYTGLLSRASLKDDSLDVVLVELDDESWRLIPERWPYPRGIWAQVVDNLTRAGAKVVVFDVAFDTRDTTSAKGDSLFAAAIRSAGNHGTKVVLAGKYVVENTRYPPAYIRKPIPALLEAGAGIGLTNEYKDLDGFTRRYIIYNQTSSDTHPYFSLGVKAVTEYLDVPDTATLRQVPGAIRYGPFRIRTFRNPNLCLINYYGPSSAAGPAPPVGPWKTFPTYPLSSVLDDASYTLEPQDEDTNWMELFYQDGTLARLGLTGESPFQDKIVIVGVSLDDFHDVKETPFYLFHGYQALMPGMEIHANAAQMILDHNYIKAVSSGATKWIMLAVILTTAGIVFAAKPMIGGIFSLLLGWMYVEVAFGVFFREYLWSLRRILDLTLGRWGFFQHLFASVGMNLDIQPPPPGHSIYLPVVLPVLGILLTYVGNVVYQFVAEQREKRWIKDAFTHFLSPKVVSELMKHPEQLRLGGERRELSVFFSDIQAFTAITERMEPEFLAEFLNEYLTAMTEIILRHGGIVDKYQGDAIMAEFGAPLPASNHAEKACNAALDFQLTLAKLRMAWKSRDLPEIHTRIGINSGDMALGNFGSRGVFDYTVMGDAVNLGARLESANKRYNTYVMISEFTYEALPPHFMVRLLDYLVVKGKTKPVKVYELLGRTDREERPFPKTESILEPYNRGIEHYFNRDWGEAIRAFDEALSLLPKDRPASLFRNRCLQYMDSPPPADWDGVFVMTTK